ncbi:hypothetical protein OBBRIDRAFT_886354 [Obba rivulosa]|uniref:Uncharacterized protein n=1 Tax=Obba rivulosa TaxID=1052685 RepID=A0A8E2DN84_9APHY|nr:hypothetical protein OBBRIDRAFT_886354 [Obba rivulosa]
MLRAASLPTQEHSGPEHPPVPAQRSGSVPASGHLLESPPVEVVRSEWERVRPTVVSYLHSLPNLPKDTSEALDSDSLHESDPKTRSSSPDTSIPSRVFTEVKDKKSRLPRWVIRYLNRGFERTLHFIRKHWVLFLLLFLSAIVSCSIGISWALRLHTFNGVSPFDPVFDANIYLSANLVSIDPTQQVMTLEWEILDYQVGVDGNGDVILCEDLTTCPDVGIYFDANLLQASSGDSNSVPSNTEPDPIFILNGTNWITLVRGTNFRPSSPIFRTDIAISNVDTHRTAQSYPFDEYIADLAIFAQSFSDNRIAVGFNAKLTDSGLASDNATYIKEIKVTRGPAIRVYAIFIVMAIWLVTLTFVIAGVAAVLLGKGIRSDVLVLPVATLFAFTQLRGTLPGAPDGFGADIDFVGILPCLALLTTCSVFMTAVFLFRNPEENTRRWNDVFVDGKDDRKVESQV